jgi:hypothetical protein
MITSATQVELVAIGWRIPSAYLIQQAAFTLGIAESEGEALARILPVNFLADVSHLRDDVDAARKDKAIAALEAKLSTGEQNQGVHALKVWRRKIAKRARRALLTHAKVPEELTNVGRSQSVARVLEEASNTLAVLSQQVATLDAVAPGTQALIDEGQKLYQALDAADKAQEQARFSDLPAAVAAFHAKKAELYLGLKIINEAGHEFHAENPKEAGKYNLSILYRNRGQSSTAPTPTPPVPSPAG